MSDCISRKCPYFEAEYEDCTIAEYEDFSALCPYYNEDEDSEVVCMTERIIALLLQSLEIADSEEVHDVLAEASALAEKARKKTTKR